MGYISAQSIWEDSIYQIEITDPIQGGDDGVTNIQPKQLTNRTQYLYDRFFGNHEDDGSHDLSNKDFAEDAGIVESKLSLDYSTAELNAMISALLEETNNILSSSDSAQSLLARQIRFDRAYGLRSELGDKKFYFEFFREPFKMADEVYIPNISTVQGDESIDSSSTSSLVVGEEYVIVAPDGSQHIIVVAEILSSTRFRAEQIVDVTITDGELYRTRLTFNDEHTYFDSGTIYYSEERRFENNSTQRYLRIRRRDVPGDFTYLYKDEIDTEWTEASLISVVPAVLEGFRDETYVLGTGTNVSIKVVTNGMIDPVNVKHLCLYSIPVYESPKIIWQPHNISPADGTTVATETPTLQISQYRHLYNLPQESLEIEVAADQAFSNVVYSAEETSAVDSHTVVLGNLIIDAFYFWRGRYKDGDGNYSPWTPVTSFSTAVSFEYVEQPSCVSPVDGAEGVTETPELEGSDFSVVGATYTHAASQWQIATNPTFSNVVWDSGEDTVNLETITVPPGILEVSTKYFWRVRHKGSSQLWSVWSSPCGFTCADDFFVGFVGSLGGENYDSIRDSAFDTSGNIYLIGEETSVDGYKEAYIGKFNSASTLIWQKKLTANENISLQGIDIDANGDVYVVGYARNGGCAILLKISSDGIIQFQKAYDQGGDVQFYDIHIADNSLYIAGFRYASENDGRPFALKMDVNGTVLWGHQLTGGSWGSFNKVKSDSAGNVYYVGSIADYDVAGKYYAVIAKCSSEGSWQWKKDFYDSSYNRFDSVYIDSNDDIYCVGECGGATICKYATDGTLVWQKQFGSGSDQFNDLIEDLDGNLVIAGYENSSGNSLGFTMKVDKDGKVIWGKLIGGNGFYRLESVSVGLGGNIFVSGVEEVSSSSTQAVFASMPTEGVEYTGSLPYPLTKLSFYDGTFSLVDISKSTRNDPYTSSDPNLSSETLSHGFVASEQNISRAYYT